MDSSLLRKWHTCLFYWLIPFWKSRVCTFFSWLVFRADTVSARRVHRPHGLSKAYLGCRCTCYSNGSLSQNGNKKQKYSSYKHEALEFIWLFPFISGMCTLRLKGESSHRNAHSAWAVVTCALQSHLCEDSGYWLSQNSHVPRSCCHQQSCLHHPVFLSSLQEEGRPAPAPG